MPALVQELTNGEATMTIRTFANIKSAKKAAVRDVNRLPVSVAVSDIEYISQEDDRLSVRVVFDHSPSELKNEDLTAIDGFEIKYAREDKPTQKKRRRRVGQLNAQPHTCAYPARAGSVQAAMIDLLEHGATMGDFRRVCIKRNGQVWDDSSIRSACYWDIAQKGYGVRTEWKNGYDLWAQCSFDDVTTFNISNCPIIQETGSEHPDEYSQADHEAIIAWAKDNGYDEEEVFPVYFLVLPEGYENAVPHKAPKS